MGDRTMDRISDANPVPSSIPGPPIEEVWRRLDTGEQEASAHGDRRTLSARFPSVGAVVATVSAAMTVGIAVAAIVLLHHRSSPPRQLPSATLVVPGGCGATKLYRGRPPNWTAPAFANSRPGRLPWPHAVSRGGNVVAIVFGNPLRAGDPSNPDNKILWIMRLPRRGLPLAIEATPLHATAPRIRSSWPADSSPGEIYPSDVNVPAAGCWQLTLRWAGHTDRIDLHYMS
jgi:hypothetical protein